MLIRYGRIPGEECETYGDNPIIDAANPWGSNFDSTMIWGPVHGAKGYIGIRFNLARNGE